MGVLARWLRPGLFRKSASYAVTQAGTGQVPETVPLAGATSEQLEGGLRSSLTQAVSEAADSASVESLHTGNLRTKNPV
jgi:hypothetical protein